MGEDRGHHSRPVQWRGDRRPTDPSRLAAYDILRADALVIEGTAFGGEVAAEEAEAAPKAKKPAAKKKAAPTTESE